MPTVIGFDTETCEGPPITFQCYSEQLPRINACVFCDGENILTEFLKHLGRNLGSGEYVLYGHNLKFDLLSLFYPVKEQLVAKRGEFTMRVGEWEITGIYGTPTFCRLVNGNCQVYIVDGFSWFRTSLAKLADLICPGLPKLEHPEGLGTKKFSPKDDIFIAYAMRDAEVSYHEGLAIDAMHHEFQLRQSLSVADMASRIFTQHFINEPIWNTGPRIMEGAVKSYHGGKNNVIPGAAPAWHSHVDAWDLSSAYPHAMTMLPAFSRTNLFAAAKVFSKKQTNFHEHGVYRISGTVDKCDWPVLFDHGFKPITGDFENIWTTGYELNEACREGEIKLTKVMGHVYDTDKDPVTNTAFQRYVSEFYDLKQNATDPVRRYLYKTLLNSIYGKFIQSREVEEEDGSVIWKHGPLYHPFAASLITGHTRSVMHRLEHEVKALHTATDGVFCGSNNSPPNGVFSWAPKSGVGCIENEGKDGDLCLLRNKLYLLYTRDSAHGWPSNILQDRYVAKYAKHGFQGSPAELERLVAENKRKYEVERPNTLRNSLRQGKVPNKFEKYNLVLRVPPVIRHYNHQ
jgi:hypothetical protein